MGIATASLQALGFLFCISYKSKLRAAASHLLTTSTMGVDDENERLAHADYWDDRYAEKEGDQLHEWFRSFQDLEEFFTRHLFEAYPAEKTPRILHLGSGDSVRPLFFIIIFKIA